jgi:hypothetical protein
MRLRNYPGVGRSNVFELRNRLIQDYASYISSFIEIRDQKIKQFTKDAFRAYKGIVSGNGTLRFNISESPQGLRDAVGGLKEFRARFSLPVPEDELYLTRTHPVVEGLASYVMDRALDPLGDGIARRCGAIRTPRVQRRTTVLVARYRYRIFTARRGHESQLLAEDCRLLAFAGAPKNAEWVDAPAAESLLQATPEGNIQPEQAADFVRRVVEELPITHYIPRSRREEARRGAIGGAQTGSVGDPPPRGNSSGLAAATPGCPWYFCLLAGSLEWLCLGWTRRAILRTN